MRYTGIDADDQVKEFTQGRSVGEVIQFEAPDLGVCGQYFAGLPLSPLLQAHKLEFAVQQPGEISQRILLLWLLVAGDCRSRRSPPAVSIWPPAWPAMHRLCRHRPGDSRLRRDVVDPGLECQRQAHQRAMALEWCKTLPW